MAQNSAQTQMTRQILQNAIWRGRAAAIGGGCLAFLLVGVLTPSFLSFDNALVIVRAASMTGIVAIGMSFVTLSGNLFALSAGSLGALLAVLFALAMAKAGLAVALVVVVLAAIGAGVAQGIAVIITRNPIIATLAFGAAFRGLAAILSGNSVLRIHSAVAVWIGTARPLGVPTQSWAFVLLTGLAWLLMRRARLGRQIILTGANRATAELSGLHVERIISTAFILLCFACTMVALFTVCQFSEARANLFGGNDFDYIAAVLIGGISLRGGEGSPVQAALGAVLISLLENLMLLNGCSAGLRITVVGLLVVVTTSAFHLLGGKQR